MDHFVFKDSLGNILKEEDLKKSTGKVDYTISGTLDIDPRAAALHEEAKQLGRDGNYDLCISKLEAATAIQPEWPYPVYDLAYTYYLKGDFKNALKYYRRTDELAPRGFFTSKTALYSMEGAEQGKFPNELYLYYMSIEWANTDEEKLTIAQTITNKYPEYAPAWKELAFLTEASAEKMNFLETGLSKNPDAETKGMLLINKASLLDDLGKHEEAVALLGNLIFSPHTTYGNVEMAKLVLRSITQITNE